MHKSRIEQIIEYLAGHFRERGIYYVARLIVLFIFASLLFFPEELRVALASPPLLALIIIGPFVLAVTLLADLLLAEQKNIGSLVFKYFFLTLSVILLFGLFYYVDATRLQPPGLHYAGIKTEAGMPISTNTLELDVFYFSATTYFTIGYGDITPMGTYARSAAVFEAFIGSIINLIVLAMAFQRFAARRRGI